MADSLIVKLGADTSEFRGELNKASQAGQQFTRGFGSALDGLAKKFGNLRSLGGALAVALGVNFQAIAERIARLWTGLSVAEEERLKALVESTDKAADAQERKLEQAKDRAEKRAQDQSEMERKQQELVWEARMKFFEEEKKYREDMEDQVRKAAYEDAKQIRDNLTELAKLRFDALKPEEKLASLKKDQSLLENQLLLDKRAGVETSEMELELQKNLNEQESIRTSLVKETAKAEAEIAKSKMNASGDLGVAKAIGGFQTYYDPAKQQEYERMMIQSATRDIQTEIDALQKQVDTYKMSGAGIGKYELPALQNRIQALRGRQSNVSDYVFNPNYQDAAGQGIFASQVSTIGDPLKLQNKQTDVMTEVSKGVGELNTRLRVAGFGTNT